MNEQHFLVVGKFNPDEPMDCLEIAHPDSCPTTDFYLGEQWYSDYACDVGQWVDSYGVDKFFRHTDDPTGDCGRQVLTPGSHPIEAWTEDGRNYLGVYEFDGGLRAASESEAGAA